MSLRIVLTTVPNEESAKEIAENLVEKKLAACVNILPSVRSIYRWQGSIHHDAELLLIIKTTEESVGALEQALNDQHPYETPEFVVIQPDRVGKKYLDWARMQVEER